MSSFRYQAVEAGGAPVKGVIEAENRKAALQLLGQRGLFPSLLERCAAGAGTNPVVVRIERLSGDYGYWRPGWEAKWRAWDKE